MTTCCGIIIPDDSDFSLSNLPLGVVSFPDATPRCATILGNTVIDLSVLEEAGLFETVPGLSCNVFHQSTLNSFIEHPRSVWLAFRQRLHELLLQEQLSPPLCAAAFHDVSTVQCHLPVSIGDYTDFYSSREHATNVGIMFRGNDNALQPNWLHLPVGYHGRSSTVFVSGHNVVRPCGQLQKDAEDPKQGSVYGPCRLLDFELEVAAVVGGYPNTNGPLTMEQAKERVFGFVLMNDWSARDLQKWEYVPLGPFTAKNFATTISPWIVMTAALEPFTAPTSAGTQDDPVPLEYLQDPTYSSYDIRLTVAIQSEVQTQPHTISTSNFKNMYWNPTQQLVHHAVSGCIMRAGDLLGSGTISGQTPDSYGSMLELSWKGSKEVKVGDEVRKFLKDGDTVVMRGYCQIPNGGRVGFGDCSGKVLPANTQLPASCVTPNERYIEFKLYGYWRSSSTWRVRIALAAKGISYVTIPVNLLEAEQTKPEFVAKSPMGQIPLLEFTDTQTGKTLHLSQSLAIIDFLENEFPHKRCLTPKDGHDRYAALEMVQIINSGTHPMQNVPYTRELEKQSSGTITSEELGRAVNEKGLAALEALVTKRQRQGPYCLGTFSPSIVDVVMVPQMYNARRFNVDVDKICPTLVQIDALCQQHPWFTDSHPRNQPDAPSE
ncbi:fumarylacetoacetase [Fistulifera solaris]|uniref:fumarylacetoacetase n=1 Tax=Fistulifera solaris TaxID=1519565 RepID=A0A1Z5JMD6_FISSO|nr:fumarylacetoacetase [Fistulifera solaris]|eukprot:GAX15183.1 fumarylacetoacetase [Fistulifera solaris]